jgi:23S rRNA pseudouridine1911/1915/1917 synthase
MGRGIPLQYVRIFMDKERIVYEDKDTIIYNKPSGILVQSDKTFDIDLMSDIKTYLVRKGERPEVFVINRLDRPVSGLVLLAKTKQRAAALSKFMQNGGINKEYMAVVRGVLGKDKGTFEDYLVSDATANTSRVADEACANAKRAVLEYEAVAHREVDSQVLSLVRIKLLTGRHHQIRVQFASRGLPLLGDLKYGSRENGGYVRGRENISLCSYKLEFSGKIYQITPEGNGFEYFSKELGILS